MSVRIYYVDESYDAQKFCLSAVGIRHSEWKACFEAIREYRKQIKTDHGVLLRKEIHASEFVAGRGRLGDRMLNKWLRSRIFFGLLELASSFPQVTVFNVCLDNANHDDAQMIAWDRLTNRIERTARYHETQEQPHRRQLASLVQGLTVEQKDSLERRLMSYHPRAIITADEGRELEITRALRKMHVFNPIPSRFGAWPSGQRTQNITTERIIEDPVFKSSAQSYFIQIADCVSFALLKRETTAVPHIERYGINKMFDQTIARVCYRKACQNDPGVRIPPSPPFQMGSIDPYRVIL